MSAELKKKIRILLGYSKSKNRENINFEDPPYGPMVKAAAKQFVDFWSYDLFDNYFQHEFKKHVDNKDDDSYIEALIQNIEQHLRINMQDVYMIVPLKRAYIDRTVTIGNLSIIKIISNASSAVPKSLPKSEIIDEICQITSIDKLRVQEAMNRITEVRAPDFLSCPLLVLKVHGQFIEMTSGGGYTGYVLKNYNTFLRLLATLNGISPSNHTSWVKAEHYMCIGRRDNYAQFALWNAVDLPFDFSFLHQQQNQKVLNSVIKIFEERSIDALQQLYMKALKFFNYSTEGQKHPLNDISYRILNVLIAGETLLLFTNRGEKKKKLANIMVGLSNVPTADKQKYYDSVIEVYNDRSSLVHSGYDGLTKYQIDFETRKRESEAFERLKAMMLFILSNFPDWYAKIQSETTPDLFLDKWKAKVSAYNPTQKLKWWQNLIVRAINLLKKVGKIQSDNL